MSLNNSGKSVVREYAEAIIIALFLAFFIRTFVVQAFKIPSGSMIPTLQIGDHLLVNKLIYGLKVPFTGKQVIPWKNPSHGDVVVFRYPRDRSLDYIKRVVGVPGDVVAIKNKKVYINKEPAVDLHAYFATETVIRPSSGARDYFGPVTVPEGKIFVMGDNRDNSSDSRVWGFVDQQDVRGKAFIIYWSWDIETALFSFERLKSVRLSRLGNIIH